MLECWGVDRKFPEVPTVSQMLLNPFPATFPPARFVRFTLFDHAYFYSIFVLFRYARAFVRIGSYAAGMYTAAFQSNQVNGTSPISSMRCSITISVLFNQYGKLTEQQSFGNIGSIQWSPRKQERYEQTNNHLRVMFQN